MKALSLRQPWADAVLYLGKSIENRHWSPTAPLPITFYIHAAKTLTEREYDACWDCSIEALDDLTCAMADDVEQRVSEVLKGNYKRYKKEAHLGAIVGIATLVEIIPPCKRISHGPLDLFGCEHPWHMPEQYGLRLADVAPTIAVPLKGELGFFEVDDVLGLLAPRPKAAGAP